MSEEDTQINLLVLSAETDFQIKMLNTNLENITAQLQQLNGNIRNLEDYQDEQYDTLNERLEIINKNLAELVYYFVNFHHH